MRKISHPDGSINSYRVEFEPETKKWRVIQTRTNGDSISHNGLAPRYETQAEAEVAISKFTF